MNDRGFGTLSVRRLTGTCAIAVAQEIKKIDFKTSRWIANDALRELISDAVHKRLDKRT